MPKGREFCYSIIPDSEFSYLNSTNVQCSPGYTGIPAYEDGEYENGCIVNMHPTIHPTIQPSLQPTIQPSLHPTIHPSLASELIVGLPAILQLFIIIETMLVSGIGLYFVYKLYKRSRQVPQIIELTNV